MQVYLGAEVERAVGGCSVIPVGSRNPEIGQHEV
jgi:hypothetical protein